MIHKTLGLLFLILCANQGFAETCESSHWQKVSFEVAGKQRRYLYKGPSAKWENGAILVLHGGGGNAEQFCEGGRLLMPQVRFAKMAIENKFAVFLLDSTDIVTDNEGKVCGKIWDDEVRSRDNFDLPYLKQMILQQIVTKRPLGSNSSVFIVGHSSGGYMTVRAASHMGNLLTAFAMVASGDPYGWTRKCDRKYGDKRDKVNGGGFDNETGKEIVKLNSCLSNKFPNEKSWEQYEGRKPQFRLFHNEFDGINDFSCGKKVDLQLRKNGFQGEPPYLAKRHDGKRRFIYHFWADEYNAEIIAFFKRHLQK